MDDKNFNLQLKEFKLKNNQGLNINILEGCEIDDPIAIILCLHGIGSHHQLILENEDCFQYKNIKFSLSKIKIFGLEFSGHGKSEGDRCSINSYNDLLEEIELIVNYIKKIYSNKKIFIYAESMGGGLAISYQIKYLLKSNIDGYILMAPMCGFNDCIKPGFFLKKLLLFMSEILPKLKILSTTKSIEDSCKNPEYLKAKLKCPYQYNDSIRLNTARECNNIVEYINENSTKFNSPIFLLHGIDDPITSCKHSIKFYKTIKSKIKKIFLTKNANHILTLGLDKNDKNPEKILDKVINFIEGLVD